MRTGEREARAARDSVLAVRAADRAGVLVGGEERARWLNGLVTCDLTKVGPGDAAYGLVVEKKGRIVSDFFALEGRSGREGLALAVPSSVRDALVPMLDHFLVMEDAEIEAAELAFWLLAGPAASHIASLVAAPWWGKVDVLGGAGAVLGAPSSEADAIGARLAKVTGEAGGAVAEPPAWEAVRIERGVPRFGAEVDETLYPQEASLERLAVSFDKGCYLGQEVVYMLEHRGHVKRKLVLLELEGEAPATPGAPVTGPDGAVLGEVKSSVVGPESGRPVALAMVKWAHTKPGAELRLGARGARVR